MAVYWLVREKWKTAQKVALSSAGRRMTPHRHFSRSLSVFNREQLVKRAFPVCSLTRRRIRSCSRDDGSTDGSVRSVQAFDDPRVRCCAHAEFRTDPARNRGCRSCGGRGWCFWIATTNGAGSWASFARSATGRAKVGKCSTAVAATTAATPLQRPTACVDYEGYLQWQEETSRGAGEAMPVVRRSAFLNALSEVRSSGRHTRTGICQALAYSCRW